MITINLAQYQNDAIATLEEHGYKFIEKKGIKLKFETPTDDVEADAKNAKALIKATKYGSVLYFNVEVSK